MVLLVGARHAQGTKAPSRKLIDGLLHFDSHILGIGRHVENHLRCALCDSKLDYIRPFDRRLCALVYWIERLEVRYLVVI